MKSILRKNDKTPEDLQDSREKLMEKAFDSLPLEGGAFRVFRKDEKGRLKVLGVLPFDEVTNPDEFIGTVEGRWGGGKYYVLPTKSGKKSGEGFYVEFDSEPKRQKKKASGDDDTSEKRSGKKSQVERELEELRQKVEAREQEDKYRQIVREEIQAALPKTDGAQAKLVNGILSNFPAVVTGLSGIIGNKETAADLLEKVTTIWTNIEGTMPRMPDPIEQAKNLADLVFSMADRVKPPPVSTGGAGSGVASFLSSFLDQLWRNWQQQGQAAAALPGMQQLQPAGVLPGMQPAAGFSGIPAQGTQGTPQQTAQGAPQATPQTTQGKRTTSQKPDVNVASGSLFQSLGIDPLATIRLKIKGREDPDEIAEFVVGTLDFIGGFLPPDSPYMPYLRAFLDYPAENFDKACTYIPELVELAQQDRQYLAKLRDAIVERIQDYRRQVYSAEPEAGDVVDMGKQPEPGAAGVDVTQEPEPEPADMTTTAE